MLAALIVLLVVAGLVVLTLIRTVRIVPQANAGLVEFTRRLMAHPGFLTAIETAATSGERVEL